MRSREVKHLGQRHPALWQGRGKNTWLQSSLVQPPHQSGAPLAVPDVPALPHLPPPSAPPALHHFLPFPPGAGGGRWAVSRCAAFALQLSEIPELMQEKGRRNVEKNNGWIETRRARHLPPWLSLLLRQTETPLKGLGPIHLSPIRT